MTTKIQEAIALRKNGEPEAALQLLQSLLTSEPTNPDINYQIAWTFDSMGKESDAVGYYEAALKNGLVEDRSGALLGLGSTYRCLGEYEKSLKTFDQGIHEFPELRSLKTFRALTLFNLKQPEAAIRELLIQLIETTSDPSIKMYDKALEFYSDKLNETWK